MFLSYQTDYLLWLQNFRELTHDVLTPFFLSITTFGKFIIPIMFLSLVYWCLNRKVGEFLFVVWATGFLFSQFLKMTFCINRPWLMSNKINPAPDALPEAKGYSFPSGHTAGATSVWGGLAVKLWDKKITRYTLIALVLLVGFSRNYLGVHYPQDVIVSLVVGITILFVLNKAFNKIDDDKKMSLKIFVTDLALFLFVVIFIPLKAKFFPVEDVDFYNSQLPGFYNNLGNIIGYITGWYLCRENVKYSTDVSWLKRIARYLPGMAIFFLLYFNAKAVLVADFGSIKGSFLYGALLAMFVTLFYPWIFTKIEKYFDLDNLQKLWKKN